VAAQQPKVDNYPHAATALTVASSGNMQCGYKRHASLQNSK
jgi:hypothetical protein